MKKFLFSTGLIVNCCFFASANDGDGVPPPPLPGAIPPPPANIPLPTVDTGTPQGKAPAFLDSINNGGFKLRKTKQSDNLNVDLKDENYSKDNFDWRKHYEFLKQIQSEQKKQKNLFDTLKTFKNKIPTDSTFEEVQSKSIQQDDSEYYVYKKEKVKNLFPDIIQLVQKKIKIQVDRSEASSIEFPLNDYGKVFVFSKFLTKGLDAINNQLQTVLDNIVKNCKCVKTKVMAEEMKISAQISENIDKILSKAHNAINNRKSYLDFYLGLEKLALEELFNDLSAAIDKSTNNNSTELMNLKTDLNNLRIFGANREKLKKLFRKLNNLQQNPFYKNYCLDTNIIEKDLSLKCLTDQGEIFSKKLKNEKKALDQYIANIKNIADSFKLGFISSYQDSTPEAVCVFHALKAILNKQEVKTALETQRITKQNANVIEKISTQANKLKDYAVFFRNLIMKPNRVYEDRLKNIIEYERTIKDLERKIEIANTLKDLQESHNKGLEEIKKIKENEKRNFLLGQKQSVEQEVIERERNWESAIKNYGSKDKEAVTGKIQCINTLLMWYKTAFSYKKYQINEYLKKLQLDEKETTFVKSFPVQDAELQKKVNAMEKFAAQLLGFNIDWTGVEVLEKGDCIVFTGLSLLDPFLSAMDIDFWITETSKFNENEEVKKQKPQQNDSSKNDLQQPKNSQDTLILAELRETNNGLNGQIATLQAQSQEQVHNAENQIAELQRENVGRAEAAKRVVRNDTENAVRNEVAEEHNAHIASLNYDNGLALKAKDEKIEELQNKNAGLEKQLIDAGLKPQDVEYVGRGSSTVFKEDEESKEDKKQLEITVKHQNEVIVRYEAELKKNAETIKKLEVTVNKQRKELDEIKNKKESEEGNEFLEMIDQKQKMLDGLQKELEDKDTLQNKKQAELDAREKLINQREKSINSKNGRNSRLLRQKMNSTVNKPVAATAA